MPSVLAQTAMIERAVIRIEGDAARISVNAPEQGAVKSDTLVSRRGVTIGEDEFYELLSQRNPGWPQLLKNFLERGEEIGLYAERKGGLNIKHPSPEGQPLNLGTVTKEGFIDTSPSTWWNRTRFGKTYNDVLAAAIGGSVKDTKSGAQSAVKTSSGKTPQISDLLPDHERVWLDAAREYVQGMFAASERSERG